MPLIPLASSPGTRPESRPRIATLGLTVAGCALGGVAAALAFPGIGWWPLAWVALVPLFMALAEARRPREAMLAGFGFGFPFYATLMYWLLAMHPLTWLGISWGVSLCMVTAAWLAVSTIMGLGIALFALPVAWLLGRSRAHGWGPGPFIAICACSWCVLEWLQSLGPFGFTWGSLAVTQVGDLPLLQVLSVAGPFALSGLMAGVAGAIAAVRVLPRRSPRLALGSVLVLVALLSGWGAHRLAAPIVGLRIPVAAVQGDIKENVKWVPGNQYRILATYLSLSREAPEAELLVWPETAFPLFLAEDPYALGQVQALARDRHQDILTGTLERTGYFPHSALYNAATVVTPRGGPLAFDAKVHLVPFGEYVPFRQFLGAMFSVLGEDMTPGDHPHPFHLALGTVDSAICFDSIIPKVIRDKVRDGAQILAVITNDAWYKRTTAAYQHEAQSQLRAVESHRYVIRAANTGVSAIIDPDGRILAQTPIFEPAVLQGQVVALDGLTPYDRYGDWAVLGSLLMLGALAAAFGALGFVKGRVGS